MRNKESKLAEVTRMLLVAQRWLTGDLAKEARIEHSEELMSTFFESVTAGNRRLLEKLRHRQKPVIERLWDTLTGTVSSSGSVFYYWTVVVFVACVYNLMTCTLGIFEEFVKYYPQWLQYNMVTDMVNLADIVMQSRKERLANGVIVRGVWKTASMYINGPAFILDLIALLPTDILLLWYPSWTIVRLNRLFKAHRVLDFNLRTEIRTNYPHLFRLLRLIFICYVMFHWNGCLYYCFSLLFDFEEASIEDWVYTIEKIPDLRYPNCDARYNVGICTLDETGMDYLNRETYVDLLVNFYKGRFRETNTGNMTKKYGLSFYWSALTLTTLGEQPWPNNTTEMMFEVTDTLLGLLLFSVIVGDIGNMITTMNTNRMKYEDMRDGCKQFMDFRKVHRTVTKQIMHYLQHSWTQSGTLNVDETEALSYLPTRLRGQLAVHIHMDTLKKSTLFKDCEPGVLYELVMHLKLQVYCPGDFVCRKHDVGKEMYIIKRGVLEVVEERVERVLARLEEGTVLGELSVLDVPGNRNGNRRTSSIRSVGYSDLYTLSKDDLLEALVDYPDARRTLVDKAKEILRKDNLLDEDAAQETPLWIDKGLTLEEQLAQIAASVRRLDRDLACSSRRIYAELDGCKRAVTGVESLWARKLGRR